MISGHQMSLHASMHPIFFDALTKYKNDNKIFNPIVIFVLLYHIILLTEIIDLYNALDIFIPVASVDA